MPPTDQYTMVESISKKQMMTRLAPNCRIHIACIVLPFVTLLALQFGFGAWILTRGTMTMPYITVAIDLNGTQRCSKSELEGKFPCAVGELFMPSDEPISPLKCRDDSYLQWLKAGAGSGHIQDNCQTSPFKISSDGKGVVIPADGLYRVYAKLTFFDKISHHTTVNLRIDQPHTDCHGNHMCLGARDKKAHTWLTCHAHQPPAAAVGTADFASCSLDGIRHLSAGEIVSLQVAIGFRNISGHYKATHMYIHRL